MRLFRSFHKSQKYSKLYILMKDMFNSKVPVTFQEYDVIDWRKVGTIAALERSETLAQLLTDDEYEKITTGKLYELSSLRLTFLGDLFHTLAKIQSDKDLMDELICEK